MPNKSQRYYTLFKFLARSRPGLNLYGPYKNLLVFVNIKLFYYINLKIKILIIIKLLHLKRDSFIFVC